MALTAGSPEQQSRTLPSAWTSLDAAGTMQEAHEALETYKKKDSLKVVVRFKAVGNAPIMKQNFYKITASNRFQAVIQFLRKELGWKAGDPLFTYINLAFSPAPDDTVSNLFKSFATDGHLIVNYSTTAAWG
ncbi:Ubiquitin-like protein [Taiwanofungus camphoratus]|nr:Ubiquitin-like protein [Antrodia cinnamomea]KAI0929448.1 Ubiquitin-like protein [Antrodia cinnamomea]KAI0946506.1 Ubiquitin-like protein [Antrodia cinnamomea]